MKLIIHIGTHRTGTTAIQSECLKHHAALKNQGLFYPTQPTIYDGHHQFAWALGVKHSQNKGNFEIENEIKKIIRDAEGRTVILSSEDFEFCKRRHIDFFLTILKKYFSSIQVICYFRHAVSYIESDYRFHVANSPTFFRNADHYLQHTNIKKRLDYFTIAKNWCGDGKTDYVFKSYKNNITGDFLETIGAQIDARDQFVNKSFSNLTITLLSALYSIGIQTQDIAPLIDNEIKQQLNADVALFSEDQVNLIKSHARSSLNELLTNFDVENDHYLTTEQEPSALKINQCGQIICKVLNKYHIDFRI